MGPKHLHCKRRSKSSLGNLCLVMAISVSVEIAASESLELRVQLAALLDGGQAHAKFEDAVKNFPVELRGVVPQGLPYSAWQLLEHIRIAQADILEFSAPPTGGYQEKPWPSAYWPKSPEPPTPQAWDQSVAAIEADRK